MNIKFQDRIDDYLLNRMNDADKRVFLQEVEQDEEKREHLEFTKNVKDSICSREEKFKALSQFQQQYENAQRSEALRSVGTEYTCQSVLAVQKKKHVQSKKMRTWLWISTVAAFLIIGFFAVKPVFRDFASPNYDEVPIEQMRGNDDVFDAPIPADSIDNDSTVNDTTTFETSYE